MHSVSRVYAQAIVQLAERRGLALPAALLAAVRGAARVPLAMQDALWDAYCRAADDPLAGLRVGLALQAGHLDSAGLQLVTCETLGEALHDLVEVAPAIGEGGGFALVRDGERVQLRYLPRLAVRERERVEAVLAGALNLARWATGGRFAVGGLWFAHDPLAPAPAYAALLDVPLRFGAAHDALVFDASQLALPLVQANAALREHLRTLTERTLAGLGQSSLAAAVQRLVLANPAWGRERVAAALGISGRHLVRRLADDRVSFRALRDAVLHDIACRRLTGARRVVDIAAELGFSDERAFVRAFRRWGGTTPARYRGTAGAAAGEAGGLTPPAPRADA